MPFKDHRLLQGHQHHHHHLNPGPFHLSNILLSPCSFRSEEIVFKSHGLQGKYSFLAIRCLPTRTSFFCSKIRWDTNFWTVTWLVHPCPAEGPTRLEGDGGARLWRSFCRCIWFLQKGAPRPWWGSGLRKNLFIFGVSDEAIHVRGAKKAVQ